MQQPGSESARHKAFQVITVIVLLVFFMPVLIASLQNERRMYIEKRAMIAKSKAHGTLFATYFGCVA